MWQSVSDAPNYGTMLKYHSTTYFLFHLIAFARNGHVTDLKRHDWRETFDVNQPKRFLVMVRTGKHPDKAKMIAN